MIDCMLFTYENRVPLMPLGALLVWHNSNMNSFNNSEADNVPMQAMLPECFPFFSVEIKPDDN